MFWTRQKQGMEVFMDIQKKEKKNNKQMIQIIPNQETVMTQKAQKMIDATTTTMMMMDIVVVATAALVEVEFTMTESRGGLHLARWQGEALDRIVQKSSTDAPTIERWRINMDPAVP